MATGLLPTFGSPRTVRNESHFNDRRQITLWARKQNRVGRDVLVLEPGRKIDARSCLQFVPQTVVLPRTPPGHKTVTYRALPEAELQRAV